ncbi:YigZ family protein [Dendrosporobacter sp. 1207_IL3150]|uniref:YigZ family protein n=1 Tax=Dendrosporobacter sp. 1207_IL3150 TaxID=3084054 RepID=UPI002FDA6FA6
MLLEYNTVKGFAEIELYVDKSRFIAFVNNAQTETEAVLFIDSIKKQHQDATHNCSAYVVGENDMQKADDDGEPSGTAGKPILEAIKKNGLRNTVIVVTRYFGGIKLGAGGLIRAYGKAASNVITAAGVNLKCLHTKVIVDLDYSMLSSIEHQLAVHKIKVLRKDFSEKVTLTVVTPSGRENELIKLLTDLTAGQAVISCADEIYLDMDI